MKKIVYLFVTAADSNKGWNWNGTCSKSGASCHDGSGCCGWNVKVYY